MERRTRGEILQDELDAFIDEVQRTTDKAEALRSFVDQNLIGQQAAVEDLELMAAKLIKRSRAIGGMIEDFANSPESDHHFAERARKLAAEAKQDLRQLYDGIMHPNDLELDLDEEFGE